mmetsp:Transcript_116232/g.292238  ORF Transcript_116232/g.292238 Transcript_116232/m.292238 type:complete len:238 (+) Transcript_116232:1488-2201(+)
MDADVGDLGLWQVSVHLPAVVARVQHSDATDIYHEHGGTQDVPRAIGRELDAPILPLIVVVDQLDSAHRLIDVCSAEYLVFGRDFAYPGIVMPQHPADRPSWVSHKDLALELGPIHKVWHRSRVVQVEMRDKHDVHLGRVDVVEVRQRAHARVRRVNAAIEHDNLATEAHHATGTPHLVACPQRGDFQHISIDLQLSRHPAASVDCGCRHPAATGPPRTRESWELVSPRPTPRRARP